MRAPLDQLQFFSELQVLHGLFQLFIGCHFSLEAGSGMTQTVNALTNWLGESASGSDVRDSMVHLCRVSSLQESNDLEGFPFCSLL